MNTDAARIPLGVALALVTGRHVARPEHANIVDAMRAHFAGRDFRPDQLDTPAARAVVRARARLAFPAIGSESSAELDAASPVSENPAAHRRAVRAWLEEREARYGPTIPLQSDRGR